MSSADKNNFISPFRKGDVNAFNLLFLALFPWLRLQDSAEQEPCINPYIRLFLTLGESSQSFTVKYEVSCRVFIHVLTKCETSPLIPRFLRMFIVNSTDLKITP